MEDLLFKKEIICPACGLRMEMSTPKDMKKHLQEITLAEKTSGKSSKLPE